MAYTEIDNPELYFQVELYTGTSGDGNAMTFDGDEDMQPDMIWVKSRGNAYHYVADSVRGVTKRIAPDRSDAETTTTDTLASFDSDGFTLDDDATNNWINYSGTNYVAWCWKESATAGFDIVSYTGNATADRSIGHSLGTEPTFIIVKDRSNTMNWPTYQKVLGNGVQFLDITDAWTDHVAYSNYWYPSGMSSSNFGIGDNANTNTNTDNFIAYLFSDRQGFSKFGKYTGNGNADGAFVYTGFRPAWVMVKKSSSTSGWAIYDNKRSSYNVMDLRLLANTSGADDQSADNNIDFLSNGFKFRASAGWNASATYVYMAFAEAPFVNSNGVPCNAR